MAEKFADVALQFKRGMTKASEVTGISARQASLRAGFNQNQVGRFLQGRNDVLLGTLERLCVKGFGMSLESVFKMGEREV